MDKKIVHSALGSYVLWGPGAVVTGMEIEMERLRLLAINPDHPHAVFLFTVERNKDKRR